MKNKFILALLLILSLTFAVLAACDKTPENKQYTVTFAGEGVSIASQKVNSGSNAVEPKDPERAGYTFKYWYTTDESVPFDFTTQISADITLNAKWEKSADQCTVTFAGEGVNIAPQHVDVGGTIAKPKNPERAGYTFKYWYLTDESVPFDFTAPITNDITLNARWDEKEATVYLNAGQYAEILLFGQSDEIQVSQAPYGVEITFKVHVYSEAKGTAVVKVNGQTLQRDSEGWYSFTVDSDVMNVTVEGLERDTTPITGVGTERDPYVLSTAGNFKRFIDAVNSPNNTRYNGAYVALASDLSFNGEELEPIGLELNSTHFEGSFDGRGHTISDFTMKLTDGLAGLFGYVVTGEVKNVHVKNAVYDIDASAESNYIVGGIVAYNMGSDVFGCSFDGNINIALQISSVNAYVGGIVGFGQGHSDTNSATISYCQSNTNITSDGIAPVLAVGGIAGCVYGSDDSAPLVIYNSVFNGSISGKIILAGGVAGYLRQDTAIANCFTNGAYVATNTAGYAAAGAFVGLSEHNTAITNSYSYATYSSTHSYQVGDVMSGTVKGEFAGNYYPDGDKTDDGSVDGKEILIVNSYVVRNGQAAAKGKYDQSPSVDFSDFTAVKALLKWNDSEWSYADGVLKTVVKQNQDYELDFTVTFDFDGKSLTVDGETINGIDQVSAKMYVPLDWIYQGNGLNTFKASDSSVSYGFFLDKEHTVRLPSAMLITSDITVYVGFADYSDVAAEYYVTDAYGNQAKLVFNDNGMLTMVYDGKVARYVYVFDGDKLLIKDGYFAYLFFTGTGNSSLITDFYAKVNGNELIIYDNLFYVGDNLLHCYKSNAVMGDWYDVEQSVYTFNLDGSGLKVAVNTLETPFTYSIDGSNVTLVIGGVTYNAALSADGRKIVAENGVTLSLDRYDIFAGEWETDFNNPVSVSFDGMGSMKFGSEDFGYTVNADGVILFEKGRAEINADGLIDITFDGNEYTLCRAHSYRGTWYDSSYEYTVVFQGIGVDGYGVGYDSEGISFTYTAEKIDEPTDKGDGYNVNMYARTTVYGYGNYAVNDHGEEFINFAVFYQHVGAILDNFILAYYDPLKGNWSDDKGVDYTFNGLGAYDINTHLDNMDWVLEGKVTVSNGTASETVRYRYDRVNRQATFTYDNAEYVVTIDVLGNAQFSVSAGEDKPLYAPDAFAEIVLAGEGCKISFNGKSASNHGVATVVKGANEQKYDYVLDGLNVTLRQGGSDVYTITLDEQSGFMIMSDGTVQVTLGMYSPISGNVYVASNGLSVSVGAISMTGEAIGTLFGEQAVFLMQTQNQLAVYVGGELLYYLVQSNDENNVGLYDAYGEFVAMLVIPDGMQGVYTARDGSSFEFDGRSLVAGYYATVIYTDKDGQEIYYYYSAEEDGSYTVFALDRDGEYDETIPVYTVYLTQHDGAVEYADEDGSRIWVVAVQAQ